MDRRWDRRPPPLPPPRVHQCPSFSASLLDAIYRSLDADANAEAGTTDRGGGAPDSSLALTLPSPSYTPRKNPAVTTPRGASSSSDASSFGFSSDGGDPPRSRPARLNRVRVRIRPDPQPPTPVSTSSPNETNKKKKKKKKEAKTKTKTRSIRTRLRDLRKGPTPSSSSTSAPLACLIKAIFSSASHLKKSKATATTPTPTSPAPEPEPSCSSARSCLSSRQKPATPPGAKRSVRFSPVSVVVGEETRPRRCLDGEEPEAALSSDSSSDLFELENLTAIGWDEAMSCPRLPIELKTRA